MQTPVGIPIGAVAPGFELPRDDGTRLKLETFRGRVVLVNFWATWCPPCAEETPSLEALHARFEAKGLTVLGVSVDDGWEPVRRFRETYRMTFPLVLDPDEEVSHRYGTFKYPESYLIDREGRVVKRYVGAVNWMRAEVTAEIASSLGSGS